MTPRPSRFMLDKIHFLIGLKFNIVLINYENKYKQFGG